MATKIERIQTILGVTVDNQWGAQSQRALDEAIRESQSPNGDPKWLSIARHELGVSERAGAADNPRIVEYHSATSLGAVDDEVPWCSAFVNWCLREAGQTYTNNAMARSFLNYGRHLVSPVPGAIVVFSRGRPPQGHVAFFLSRAGSSITVLGGNQGDKVSIASYPSSSVIGYRWPV